MVNLATSVKGLGTGAVMMATVALARADVSAATPVYLTGDFDSDVPAVYDRPAQSGNVPTRFSTGVEYSTSRVAKAAVPMNAPVPAASVDASYRLTCPTTDFYDWNEDTFCDDSRLSANRFRPAPAGAAPAFRRDASPRGGMGASCRISGDIYAGGGVSGFNARFQDTALRMGDNFMVWGVAASYQPNKDFDLSVRCVRVVTDSLNDVSANNDNVLQVAATVRF